MINVDICVIGGGSGGLAVASGAAQLGASTVLFEAAKMGGDCLNYGCVPSKALLGAARHAHNHTRAAAFGVNATPPSVDFQAVHDHIHGVIGAIAPHDSVERFTGLGVNVIQETARFTGPTVVEGDGGAKVTARRFVVATGSAAGVPPIPGLDDVPYFTNENIFDNTTLPEHLIVVGAGPIGMEMAQAHCRLGAKVTVLEMFRAFPRDDQELADIVVTAIRQDGVALREGVAIDRVERDGDGVAVVLKNDDGEEVVRGSHLLIAAGRRPNVNGLGLESAGVEYTPKGIKVDRRLRSTNKNIFAIGDVAGSFQFTHVAGYHAGIVIRNALFRIPAKTDDSAVPWVTYTDPELASVGMNEAAAREAHGDDIRIMRWPFAENDRAQADRVTDGFVKVITTARGRILGAALVGDHAGELLQPWILAISAKLKIGAMANIIAPYPTLGEVNKRAASSYYIPKLFSNRTRSLVRLLRKLG